jgi:hypothetical protein
MPGEIIAVAVVLMVGYVLLFALAMFAYINAINRNKDLEDKLMARNLTEYSQKKINDAFIKNAEKIKPDKNAPKEDELKEGEII